MKTENTKYSWQNLFFTRARAHAYNNLIQPGNRVELGLGYSSGLIFGESMFKKTIFVAIFVGIMISQNLLWGASPASIEAKNALKSNKAQDRLKALEKIQTKEAKISFGEFKKARRDEQNPKVRREMNRTLSSFEQKETLDLLIEALLNDSSELVQKGAAEDLAKYAKNQKASNALAKALEESPSALVRYACALSLSLSESDRSLEALEKASQHSDPRLRQQVAFSLKRHKSRKAKRILRILSRDKNSSVRHVASEE